jgi:cytochrome b
MADEAQRQLVWDIPTRVFHWLLVGLLLFSWWSAETYHLDWHQYSGITVLALLIFRILWGLIGTNTARFSQFVRGPGAVISYVRPSSTDAFPIGHNPVGGWSVVLMLLLLLVQVGTGLFAVDVDGIESGPLSYMVDFDQGRTASAIHHLSFTLLLLVGALHIVAILFYLFVKRRNLVGPMITGSQQMAGTAEADSAVLVPRWRVVVAAIIAILIAYWVKNGLKF